MTPPVQVSAASPMRAEVCATATAGWPAVVEHGERRDARLVLADSGVVEYVESRMHRERVSSGALSAVRSRDDDAVGVRGRDFRHGIEQDDGGGIRHRHTVDDALSRPRERMRPP